MPLRDVHFVEGSIYHVFNKTVGRNTLFLDHHTCRHFLNTLFYYRSSRVVVRYSQYRKLPAERKYEIYPSLIDSSAFYVHILAYCLMPNHFHLLLCQRQEDGIQKCLSNTINSFTRHINIKSNRKGPFFLPRFKAVPVTSDEQLKHVSRYIHLNPYSSHVIPQKTDLERYKYSSFKSYVSPETDKLLENEKVMELFSYDTDRYRKFVLQNADYQEQLEHLKHTYKW